MAEEPLADMMRRLMGQGSIAQNLVVEAVAGQTLQPMLTSMAAAPYLAAVAAQAEVVAAIMERLAEPGVVTFQQLAVRLEVEEQAVLVLAVIMVAVTAVALEATPKMVGQEGSLEVEAEQAVEL